MAKRRTRSKSRSRFLLCIAILLLCGIAAEGFLLYHRAHPPVIAAESQPERNPAWELNEALRGCDYSAAAAILQSDFTDKEIPEKAVQLLRTQTDEIRTAYEAGDTAADDALRSLRAIAELKVPAVSEDAAAAVEQIRMHEAACACQQQAAAFAAAGDYAKAIAQYQLIPKEETALYADAQKQIEICSDQRLAHAVAEADRLCAAEDYAAAAELLKQRLADMPEADVLREKLDEITETRNAVTKKQQDAELHEQLKSARTAFDAKDYSAAFEALQKIPDMPEKTPVTENYRKMYLLHLQTETRTLLKEGKLVEAEKMIAES